MSATDSNRNDSLSKANQYQENVVLGLAESFSCTLFALLHSREAMEANLSNASEIAQMSLVSEIVHQSFLDVEARKNFQPHELSQFRDLRDRVFHLWKSLP